jgi:hypothetical protein
VYGLFGSDLKRYRVAAIVMIMATTKLTGRSAMPSGEAAPVPARMQQYHRVGMLQGNLGGAVLAAGASTMTMVL